MKNPIKEARKKLNCNPKELAFLVGITEQTIRWNERGDNLNITPKLLNFLVQQGYNKDDLNRQYKEFRQWKQQQLLDRLKA